MSAAAPGAVGSMDRAEPATEAQVVRNRRFSCEAVVLDGKEFVGCRFDRCELLYSGGPPFFFEESSLDDCKLSFVGRAENTVHALAAMHRFGMRSFVEEMFELIRTADCVDA